MVSMGATFPASFLQNAEATTEYGIIRYTIEVSEAEASSFTRTWKSSNGQVLHTSTSPPSYDSYDWVLTNFPPPAHLDPSDLSNYVHDRRPGRRTLRITLIHAVDLPAWEQALADDAAARALDDPDPQELHVGTVRPLADGSGIELLTQVPWGISLVGLYQTEDLVEGDWRQAGSAVVEAHQFWVQAHADENNGFFFVANHSLDSDGDGLVDALEIFVQGTDANNADSDGDGILDGDELWLHGTDALLSDSDGDGLDDGFEIDYGGDPHSSTTNGLPDALLDLDGDGLNAQMEQSRGTDPTNHDTDGDGESDLVDAVGYDDYFTFTAAPETRYVVQEVAEHEDSTPNEWRVNNLGDVVKFTSSEFTVWRVGEGGETEQAFFRDLNNQGQILYEKEKTRWIASKAELVEVVSDDEGLPFGFDYEKSIAKNHTGVAIEDDESMWFIRLYSGHLNEDGAHYFPMTRGCFDPMICFQALRSHHIVHFRRTHMVGRDSRGLTGSF